VVRFGGIGLDRHPRDCVDLFRIFRFQMTKERNLLVFRFDDKIGSIVNRNIRILSRKIYKESGFFCQLSLSARVQWLFHIRLGSFRKPPFFRAVLKNEETVPYSLDFLNDSDSGFSNHSYSCVILSSLWICVSIFVIGYSKK